MTRLNRQTTQAIRQWLKKYNFDSKCQLGNDFECIPDTHTIIVNRNYNSYADTEFMHCLRNLGLKYNFDCITLSVLHELGHSETEHLFSEDDWAICAVQKFVLYDKSSTMPFETYINKYWEIKDEKMANIWLVNYVNNFAENVAELEKNLEKIDEEVIEKLNLRNLFNNKYKFTWNLHFLTQP